MRALCETRGQVRGLLRVVFLREAFPLERVVGVAMLFVQRPGLLDVVRFTDQLGRRRSATVASRLRLQRVAWRGIHFHVFALLLHRRFSRLVVEQPVP